MSKPDRRRQKKQKRRQERLRQAKHARQSQPATFYNSAPDEDEDQEGAPLDNGDLERVLRTAAWKAERAGADGAESLLAMLREQLTGELWRQHYAEAVAADPREKAQDLAFQACEATSVTAGRRLALQALEHDPDNLDALRYLFEHSTDRPGIFGRMASLMRGRDTSDANEAAWQPRFFQALESARHSLAIGPAIAERDGMAWGRVRARPFLRALPVAITQAAEDLDISVALPLAEELFALDGARKPEQHTDCLLGLYLAADRLDDARRLLATEVDAERAIEPWARAIERFLAGDRLAARFQVERGRAVSPEVEDILMDRIEEDDATEDARQVSGALAVAVAIHDDLQDWFEQWCSLTTEDERTAAQASYPAPVSALLTLGTVPSHTTDHAEQVATVALGPEQVPDLLRMANDQALHELEQDDPGVYAPVHAVVALTRIAAAGSLDGLLAVVERRIHDEWLEPRLHDTVAALGPPALTAMSRWLGDAKRSSEEREFAADTLARITALHPDVRDRVVALHIQELRHHREQSRQLNATLASNLAELHAVDAERVVRDVFEAGTIDVAMSGTFTSWQTWAQETPAQREDHRAELIKRIQRS